MENRNSYTIVGLFFIFCVSAFAVFIWWMSDSSKKSEYTEYYIITDELPTGLRVESQVKFVGVVVGSVSNIKFKKDDLNKIELTLKIRDDIPIKKDSLADIEHQIISGISSINISRGSVEFHGDDRTIMLNDSLLAKIKDNAQNIGDKISQSLTRLDALLSDDSISHLQNTLKSIDELVSGLGTKQNLENISELLSNLNTLSNNLNNIKTKEINSLINNANSLINSANSVINGLNDTQKLLNQKLQNGQYDIKDAVYPVLNETSEFLKSFSKTLREVRNALNRLEDNPYEFFFKDTSGDKR